MKSESSATELRSDPTQAVLDAIRRAHVDFEPQTLAVQTLRDVAQSGLSRPAEIIVMETQPFLGKSRVIDIVTGVVSSGSAPALPDAALRVTCLPGCNGKILSELIAQQLEVPAIGIGNFARSGSYLVRHLQRRRKPLLFVDNAHCLYGGAGPLPGVIQVLGAIVASGAAAVFLSGRRGTKEIATTLSATVGREPIEIELWPMPYTTVSDLEILQAFLGLLAHQIKPALAGTGIELQLHTIDMAKRFWGASWGVPGTITILLQDAIQKVLRVMVSTNYSGSYVLRAEDFGEAFRVRCLKTSSLGFNPFTRGDAPTLGEINDAIEDAKRKRAAAELELPTAPKFTGARLIG